MASVSVYWYLFSMWIRGLVVKLMYMVKHLLEEINSLNGFVPLGIRLWFLAGTLGTQKMYILCVLLWLMFLWQSKYVYSDLFAAW